ncbi:lysophosphatidic acid phosphatase type 6 [Huso huso]|uniref:Lysophosphatidic acid phosphatase type 6 n=1 Tax=Huso huso TaxID=61971 RepID=A0ABR0ZLC4_HUSHU
MGIWARIGAVSTAACGAVVYWLQPHKRVVQADRGRAHPFPYELKLVQVLFRHGARTPLKSIPDIQEAEWVPNLLKDPSHTSMNYVVTNLSGGPKPPSPIEDSYRGHTLTGGTFPGQLTTLGKQQLYDLGARIRKTYIEEFNFLSPIFRSSEVYVRSTNIVRTIESATCLLAGLFQQKQEGAVKIQTSEAETEILYPNYHGCKLLKLLSRHRWTESALLPDIAEDLKRIQSLLGIVGHKHVDFIQLRDDLVAREAHGLPCPTVLKNWQKTVEERAVEMVYYIYEPNKSENLQLSVGPLLHTLMANIEKKIEKSSDDSRKLYLYSVHDTTLMPCLMALGIFDMKWPPYAADIALELYEHLSTKEVYIKVSYIGQDQLVRGCSDVFCPLNEFRKALLPYMLDSKRHGALCNQTENITK